MSPAKQHLAACAAALAKAARRAAVKAIEDRKAAGQPSAKPVAKRGGQQNSISEARGAFRLSVVYLI
jgi:hypothetical protein